MTEAFIQPNLLRWAIDRSRLPIEKVAQGAHVKPEQIISWQDGQDLPTFNQAQKLAHALRVPFGYLFLSTVPDEKLLIPDLRTVHNATPTKFSADFVDLLNSVLRKQQWYREYLQQEGYQPLSFIGKFNLTDDPNRVAEDISQTLGINEELRQKVSNWGDFLQEFIHRAEANSILVLRNGVVDNDNTRKLSVDEFRGFAISDEFAPLIFINARDYKVAKIFTLAHELAHLWIGESGISNLSLKSAPPNLAVEIFCDRVAAQLLVPEKIFLLEWREDKSIEFNVERLVSRFRVSSIVILRRALDLKRITKDDFFYYYDLEIENQNKRKEDSILKSSGGNFHATLFARNSRLLTNTVISLAYEGRLLYRDAASLLGVKVKSLDNIAKKLEIR
jgi:Zn-dependent peptidase ImmA (M78 family)